MTTRPDPLLSRLRQDVAALTQKLRNVTAGEGGSGGGSGGIGGVAAFAIDPDGNLTVGYAGAAPTVTIDADGFLQLEI